jgi:KAP-like P-loop domain-containing protein
VDVGMKNRSDRSGVFEPIRDVDFDHLGRYQFARRLLKRVSALDCSSAVGLYGGWGVGKTSILNLMTTINEQDRSSPLEKPLLEYIDVWPYEVSGDLALPILVQMRQWMAIIDPAIYSVNWRKIFGVLAQAGTDLVLRKFVGLNLSDVKEYAENIKALEILVDDIRGAQDAFCDLAELISKAHQNRRIVFLVDNLDRCSPENVVRLLESVKNFLHAPNCVWVFAMDAGVIASYIDHKYDGTLMDGNSYLDKIVPEQYHIPPISDRDMTKLQRFLAVVQPANTYGLPVIDLGKIPQIPEVLVPRRLLKTAHKFYEAYTGNLEMGSAANPDVVFSLILLYNAWPGFYERFSSGKAEHVRGVLANFIDKDQRPTGEIPLSEKFKADQALKHYLNHCFIHGQNPETFGPMLVACMTWLREVGLP